MSNMTKSLGVCALLAVAGLASAAPRGEADGEGKFTLTEAEAKKAAAEQAAAEADGSAAAARERARRAGWGTEPLGPEKGTLVFDSTFKNKPVFGKRSVFKPGLLVAGKGVQTTVVYSPKTIRDGMRTDERPLAEELVWHLKRMCPAASMNCVCHNPAKKKPFSADPAQVTVFVLNEEHAKAFFGVDYAAYPVGTSFLKQKGSWFLIGGNRSGASHALTYLLESLGCRYLWPSAAHHGKIVPPLAEVRFPELDWTFTPAMKMRGIRTRMPRESRFVERQDARCRDWLGIGGAEFYKLWKASRDDESGFRDFWAWHGVSDLNTLDGEYEWGHAFGDYWKRFGRNGTEGEHLEFFALQPDGSRDQGAALGDQANRATLCLSNRGLIEQTAKDFCDRFRKNPSLHALSIALPDGGPTKQCQCEACRRLDPKCGWKAAGYVCLTDRVMWFNNEVAKLVAREFPTKRLCFQSYSMYSGTPYCVAPSPKLVVFDVNGEYTRDLQSALGSVAKWTNYGAEAFWRPNLMWGYRTVAPQNYARRIFEDVEMCKVNNVVGTDFDCYLDRWSQFGFSHYMLARAMLNPDRLTFDDIADDYFVHAFGPAAPAMKRYWDELERVFNEAAVDPRRTEGRPFYRYQRHLRYEPLEACFAEAKKLAAGDELILRRIAFFEVALPAGKIEQRIVQAFDRDDLAGCEKELLNYYAFVKDESLKDMPANNPLSLMDLYMSASANWLEWRKKPDTKVVFDEKHYNEFYKK